METRVTSWRACADGPWYPDLSHGGYEAYRIWQQTDGRRWWQRHEWRCADGSIQAEDWIDGVRDWCAGATPVGVAA